MPQLPPNKSPAYLCLVLHAHLPFVRHPEYPEFLEEKWLFEAVRECYLPLLRILKPRLHNQNATARFTISLSPTLAAMLDDPLLRTRIARYLERVASFADAEVARTSGEARWQPLAVYYQSLAQANLATWHEHSGDVISGFLSAEKAGAIELITTAATHAFLPLWRRHPEVVRAQIRIGIESFAARTGHRPAGFWLPECGYFTGMEKFLADEGIRYFFSETHGILHASPPPHGIYEPVACPNGVAVFGRDPDSSKQVWSSHGGYPGDFDYREYYRDIGKTLPVEQLEKYFPLAPIDRSTGFKYHRVTGTEENKEPYHPVRATAKAQQHAQDFLHRKRLKADEVSGSMKKPPLFTAPFDAELFGHWWFEGPQFLEALLGLCDQNDEIEMVSPSGYLEKYAGDLVEATPSASTWGSMGYSVSWVNDATAWMYPHLYRAVEHFALLEGRASQALEAGVRRKLMHQAARELLLAQASDWPFMMNAGHHSAYAEKRVRDHLARYHWLADALMTGSVEEKKFAAIAAADTAFADTILEKIN